MRPFSLHDLLRCADRDDPAPFFSSFGAKIDDPVGRLDDVQVVFDDEEGMACLKQLLERRQQLRDVVEVQPCRRLVEDVEHAVAAL